MFFMKHKGKKLTITEDNIYTICPQCGQEHTVDISDVLSYGGDLYGTNVFCETCTAKRQKAEEIRKNEMGGGQ